MPRWASSNLGSEAGCLLHTQTFTALCQTLESTEAGPIGWSFSQPINQTLRSASSSSGLPFLACAPAAEHGSPVTVGCEESKMRRCKEPQIQDLFDGSNDGKTMHRNLLLVRASRRDLESSRSAIRSHNGSHCKLTSVVSWYGELVSS